MYFGPHDNNSPLRPRISASNHTQLKLSSVPAAYLSTIDIRLCTIHKHLSTVRKVTTSQGPVYDSVSVTIKHR